MTKRNKKQNWQALLLNPLLQQVLALLTIAVGAITLLAAFRVTQGRWASAWVNLLRHLLGWGVYPVALGITLAGLLWLQHHLDRSAAWRWRPFVGAELVFFSLLALTHAIRGRGNLWRAVESGWGGGLVGWATTIMLSTYLGWPATILILVGLLLLGLGMAFDVTIEGIRETVEGIKKRLDNYRTHRVAQKAAQGARRNNTEQQPSPQRADPSPPKPTRDSSIPIHRKEPILPPLSLLNEGAGPSLGDKEIREKSRIIKKTLAQFGLPVEVVEVRIGPSITQFGVEPGFVERAQSGDKKVRVKQISQRSDDLAVALATPRLRIEAPVPGRPFVGIEVPNAQIQVVSVREVMKSKEFRQLDSPLAIALGQDVAGEPVVADLSRMPHLLIAGTTGSGKSVCIKSITTCLTYNNMPQDLRMVMIDPKMVELVRFNGLPHLYGEVEVDLERVVKVLRWVALEMDDRYKRFADASARNLDDFNRKMKKQDRPPLSRIVVLIDELADLMMLAPEAVEQLLCRIAQMGRATGIHLIVATQRPSTDVVTGLIKANFPARISFATASQIDSRVIIDMPGAETLLGDGDMLYLAPDAGHPVRVQGCYVSEEELDRVIAFWRKEIGPVERKTPWQPMMPPKKDEEENGFESDYVDEDMLQRAIALVKKRGNASASLLQRRLRIGYPRAARLIEVMAEMDIIGPPVSGGRKRSVLIGEEEEEDEQ